MATTPIEEKIAALLRKAESTDSPHEAEALSEAAEKLMLKHGIERAMLEMDTDKKEEIVVLHVELKGTYAYEQMLAATMICQALKLKAYYSDQRSWGNGVRLSIVGHESDARDAKNLVLSLLTQATVAVKAWAKGEGKRSLTYLSATEKYKARRSFIEHFGAGAAKRIRENRIETIVEMGTGTELVLVDRAKQVNDFYENLGLKSKADRRDGSWTGAGAGYAAGQNAATGERGITGTRAIGV